MGMTKSEFMARYINDYYDKRNKKRQLENIGHSYVAGRVTQEFDKKNKRKKRGIQ